ncbi:hypothetical protein VTN77DRAFT_2745 [Rasamsonia byssochlamydoides]|uniref:uncharacterized protein n=1 Tax=Rasamsonia byssochlamydoides TaxID=89139 RepID=UPI00374259C3
MSPRAARGVVVSVVFTTMATCLVSARLYTRIHIINRTEANDLMVLAALMFSFVFMGLFIAEAKYGMGKHMADIPPNILSKQMKVFWATIPFYNAAVICAKASILLQYFRVFPTKRMRIACWVMLVVLATYGSWAVLSAFLNCIPVSKFWAPETPGYCLNMKALWFSNASMHISTDLAILIIPIPALNTLDLPRRQKLALMGIFAVGGFVCVTSIIRLFSLKVIADSSDPTYDNVGAATWSAIECNTGIICACLPTLRPLVSRILPRLLSTISASRSHRRISEAGCTPTDRNGTQASTTGEEYRVGKINLESLMLMPCMPRITRDGTIELPKPVEVRGEKENPARLTDEIDREKTGSESSSSR